MKQRSSRQRAASAIAVATLAVAIGCRDRKPSPSPSTSTSTPTSPSTSTPTSPSTPTSTPTPILESPTPFVALPVAGFADAVVSVPTGASSPRPIVVVAHGLDDRPEGQCDVWRWIVDGRAFVVCPRGVAVVASKYEGFTYPGGEALAREVDAAVEALRAQFAPWIADGPMVYAGFSLGANLGVHVVERAPSRFPYVVLTEGGEDAWTTFDAKQFQARGGKRILFACGLAVRVATANVAASRLVAAGIDSKVVLGKLPGKTEFMHWYNGPVADEIRAQLDWLVEGDSRWTR